VSFLAREDLVDAIEVLRAARVPRPADGGVEAMVFVGGNRVAVAALYLDAWIGFTRPECGRAVIARPSAGMVNVVLAGPVVVQWERLLTTDATVPRED